jgi:putative methyltransferase (TIGR04325 family)
MDAVQRVKNLRVLRPLRQLIYDRRFANNRSEQLYRGIFGSMAEAAASAPATRPIGYDQAESAGLYAWMHHEVAIADYPMLYWMHRLAPEVRTLFDYGGHTGIKYYAYAPFVRFPDGFVWTVSDVPAIARAGAALARERGAANLRFVSDFAAVDGQDLLFCSGSLQYIDDSLATLLGRVARRPRHVLVNTTPFDEGPTFYTLNSIGTAFCPYKVQNYAEFAAGMTQLGYEVVHRWSIPGKNTTIPMHPERSTFEYRGLYLRAQ